MAYWLYVDGPGSWTYSGRFYRGGTGPWEVDLETYNEAAGSESGDLWLFVADEKPMVPARRPPSGVLTATDLLHGTEDTARRQELEAAVAVEAAKQALEEEAARPEPPEVTNAGGRTPCPVESCDKDYASPEALERHVATKHPGVTT